VEASLLPSKEFAKVAKKVILAVVRSSDTACKELPKEFDIPYWNSWVVVLDAGGETLASWIGDGAGGRCREDTVAKFPANLVALIEKSLRVGESLQELERRWQKAPANLEAFDKYSRRLQGMHAFGSLQRICMAQARNPRLGVEQRNEYRIREYLARGSAHVTSLHTEKGRARFALEGEKLLVELAAHPKTADLPSALFAIVYAHGFDVPARTKEAIARLQQAACKLLPAVHLNERIRELRRVARDWTNAMKEHLQKADTGPHKQFLAASLGDAQAAIELFSQPGYKDVPEYRERVRAAKRKLRTLQARAGLDRKKC
jgi:hypothetical protein